MQRKKHIKIFLWALLFVVLGMYVWNQRRNFPCLLGQTTEVHVGGRQVAMAACWYPFFIGSETPSVHFVQKKMNPLARNGYLDMLFLPTIGPDLHELVRASTVRRKYSWGTAVLLDKSWMYRLMKREPSPEFLLDEPPAPDEHVTVFVPEKGMLIRALNVENLDSILAIDNNSLKPTGSAR